MSKINPPKITKWKKVTNEDELLSAMADVHSPGFGNVGKHVGYIIDANKDMKNWDYEDKMNADWLLKHPNPRIITNYTRADIGYPPQVTYADRHYARGNYESDFEVDTGWIEKYLFIRSKWGWLSVILFALSVGRLIIMARFGIGMDMEPGDWFKPSIYLYIAGLFFYIVDNPRRLF